MIRQTVLPFKLENTKDMHHNSLKNRLGYHYPNDNTAIWPTNLVKFLEEFQTVTTR